MAVSAEQIQALADAVSLWRMQECIYIASYCAYVTIIYPQRWSRGKTLYMAIRYGLLVYIALDLSRSYRNYLVITPQACKALQVIDTTVRGLVLLMCDFSLGLCLGALLRVRALYLVGIVILSCGPPFVATILNIGGSIQYPAEPVSNLDMELGYPCYVASAEVSAETTITYLRIDIRTYLNLAATILLALLGLVTLFVRYKGNGGRLIQVIRRDGGIHYLSLLAIRLIAAIVYTPALVSVTDLDSSPVNILITAASQVVIPTIAQRLLINMRKVDYMGSQPVASKLLFAPPASDDGSENDFSSSEMGSGPAGSTRPAITEKPGVINSREGGDSV